MHFIAPPRLEQSTKPSSLDGCHVRPTLPWGRTWAEKDGAKPHKR